MEPIIWHKGMACKVVTSGWDVSIWESFDKSQREVTARPRRLYIPLGDVDQSPCDWAAHDGLCIDLELLESRAVRSAEISAARARKYCRLKIKNAKFNEMLTLTTRVCCTDLAQFRTWFSAWLRKMRRAIPGFRAVYGFEEQSRGAWHCHLATDRLPRSIQFRGSKVQSYRVGTALWRDVVGVNNGMCFVGGKGGRFQRYRSTAKIAGYISKYLTKSHASGVSGSRMWDSTRDLTPPAVIRYTFPDGDLGDLIPALFDVSGGHVVVRHVLGRYKDFWLLYSELPP